MICIILGTAVILLCYKLYFMKKAVREITAGFAEKLQNDTNTIIGISSSDRDMRALADSINKQLVILRNEQLRLRRGSSELENVVTNISHDLRTPLTAICGYLELMKKTTDPEKQLRYIETMSARAEHMKQLTEELFKSSVIVAKDEPAQEELFVNQLLAESITSFYPAIVQKGITPEISITEQKVVRRVNRSALERVFANLIGNALKYSSGDLEVSLSGDGTITFSNTAKELTYVNVNQLFDRFYTVDSGGSSTGLGLSIARTLVESMGGSISAECENNRLTVTINL